MDDIKKQTPSNENNNSNKEVLKKVEIMPALFALQYGTNKQRLPWNTVIR